MLDLIIIFLVVLRYLMQVSFLWGGVGSFFRIIFKTPFFVCGSVNWTDLWLLFFFLFSFFREKLNWRATVNKLVMALLNFDFFFVFVKNKNLSDLYCFAFCCLLVGVEITDLDSWEVLQTNCFVDYISIIFLLLSLWGREKLITLTKW